MHLGYTFNAPSVFIHTIYIVIININYKVHKKKKNVNNSR